MIENANIFLVSTKQCSTQKVNTQYISMNSYMWCNQNKHLCSINSEMINSLWPSDAIRQHPSGSTLVLVMAGHLTHWGPVTNICVGNLTITGSYNGLVPGWHQAIIWISVGILLIGPLGTNFSEILIKINTFSFKKMHLKMLFAKWRPFCFNLSELTHWPPSDATCHGSGSSLMQIKVNPLFGTKPLPEQNLMG